LKIISDATDLRKPVEVVDSSLNRILAERAFKPGEKPPEIIPVYSLMGTPVSTARNITTLYSRIKAGKTAVMGAMIASTIPGEGPDLFGFSSQNPDQKLVLAFDTEQDPADHWAGIERMLRRAGVTEAPRWFRSYWLLGLKAKEAWRVVTQTLRIVRNEFPGIHS